MAVLSCVCRNVRSFRGVALGANPAGNRRKMGSMNSKEIAARAATEPSDRLVPYNFEKPSFDPNFGFPEGRKQRVMIATDEQMIAAKIPQDKRDYCAHHLLDYQACRNKNIPFLYRCHHERHTYMNCEYEDHILRMKEFERERRLRAREQRLLAAQ